MSSRCTKYFAWPSGTTPRPHHLSKDDDGDDDRINLDEEFDMNTSTMVDVSYFSAYLLAMLSCPGQKSIKHHELMGGGKTHPLSP